MSKEPKNFYEFGPFRIDPDKMLLLRENQPVPLPPKAFETLLVLVRRSETLVSKDELMKSVWPDTFVEESNLAQNIFVLRKALGESASGARRYIVTVPGRGYRFAEKVEVVPEALVPAGQVLPLETGQEIGKEDNEEIVVQSRSITRVVIDEQTSSGDVWRWLGAAAVGALVVLVAGLWYWRTYQEPKLSNKDSIVIADFANSTGDPLFDDTLKQALAIQLEQSPYLRVVPDVKVRSTLKLMNRPPTEPITQEIAHEICQRDGSKAVLAGSIGSVGSHYLIGLRAVECQSGETLASAESEAANRDGILASLGAVGNSLRGKLGESLASVQKFNKPLAQATTSSLEALKVYTTGTIAAAKGDDNTAAGYYARAIMIDPDFARAYASLGSSYNNLDQPTRALENYKKAYTLRDRVSDRERYYIEATYYGHVTAEAEKAIESYREWIQNYPQDFIPHFNLGSKYDSLGEFEKALPETLEAMRLAPDDAGGYLNLMGIYLSLERWDDARKIYEQALAHNLDNVVLREKRYDLAFLQNDAAGMKQQFTEEVAKPTAESSFLELQADTEAYFGRFASARDFSDRAIESAMRHDAKEVAAVWQSKAALRDAEVGEFARARSEAQSALAMSSGLSIQFAGGLALARSGDYAAAQKVASQLDQEFPRGTMVQGFFLPSMRAAIRLAQNDPAEAIHLLGPAESYELGGNRALYPAYLRGIAYLKSGKGSEAANEFQKLIKHRGVLKNSILGALANLQVARAQAISGDQIAASNSWQQFLALWKDADPDLPILKEARAEYANLQSVRLEQAKR